MVQTVDRRDRLDTAITGMAADSEFTPIVDRLCCLRGVTTLTGFALAVEIGDWTRLDGRRIGSYVGLTPSESSSGASRTLGGIIKIGNGHAQRLLIEAAWHHRPAYRPSSPIMRARWDRASAAARARGHAGNQRLHDRWQSFQTRGKRTVVAQRRDRPRAGRLVLVPDRHDLTPASEIPVADGGDGSVRATRDMPYEQPGFRVTLDL